MPMLWICDTMSFHALLRCFQFSACTVKLGARVPYLVVTGLRARQRRNCDSISVKDKRFFSSPNSHSGTGPSQPFIQWVPLVGTVFPGVKLTIHLHLVPRSRICGAILPPTPYAFLTCVNWEESVGHIGCVIEDVTMLHCLNAGLPCLSLPSGPRCIGALFRCRFSHVNLGLFKKLYQKSVKLFKIS
jgi:hypothetical protein